MSSSCSTIQVAKWIRVYIFTRGFYSVDRSKSKIGYHNKRKTARARWQLVYYCRNADSYPEQNYYVNYYNTVFSLNSQLSPSSPLTLLLKEFFFWVSSCFAFTLVVRSIFVIEWMNILLCGMAWSVQAYNSNLYMYTSNLPVKKVFLRFIYQHEWTQCETFPWVESSCCAVEKAEC